MKGKKKAEVKDYFYTNEARPGKIYVFWNGGWLNQLMKIGEKYHWISLNECGTNYGFDEFISLKAAIENVMDDEYDVYQLDTLEELAEFIKSEEEK